MLQPKNLLKNAGIPFTILRNGWYTENYGGSVASGLGAGTFMGSSGNGKISSAPRKDYAEAVVAVATTEGHQAKVYKLAGDKPSRLATWQQKFQDKRKKIFPIQIYLQRNIQHHF